MFTHPQRLSSILCLGLGALLSGEGLGRTYVGRSCSQRGRVALPSVKAKRKAQKRARRHSR